MVSLFMLGHVPRAEQAPLLGSIASWLREGGYLLATMGTADADDEVEDDWLGAPMFFASFDEAEDRRLLGDAGFELIEAKVIPSKSPATGRSASCGSSRGSPSHGRRRAAAARRRPDR